MCVNDTGIDTCTIIRAVEDNPIILSATFFSPVGGTIFFRQSGTDPVSVFGKFYYTNGMARTEDHGWHVHINAVSDFSFIKILWELITLAQKKALRQFSVSL